MTAAKRTLLGRLFAAYPLLVAYLMLLTLYAWQTTRTPSPWIFTDELQWSLLSRGVAHTGHPQLREHAESMWSLYSYFLAPAWWAGATAPGYAAAKYLNAIVMTASLFPAYGLARFFVPRTVAIGAGVAAAAIPSLALTGVLMSESLAYFWSTLVLYLLARALLQPRRATVLLVVAATLLAPGIRAQLQVLLVAALIAFAVCALTGPRARSLVTTWAWDEAVGAALLMVGGVIFLDVLVAHHSYEWFIGTHFWHRAFTYGLWALGAFTIGVGVIPVLLALAWALGGPIATVEDRALLGLLAGSVFAFGVYTAVKASYISTNFSIRIEERNLIYLSPLAFICAARLIVAGRVRIIPTVLATGATGWLLWSTPYHAYEHLYSDAYGLSILQWLNQTWYWTVTDLRWLLFGILAAGAALAAATRLAPHAHRVVATVAAVLGVAIIAWNLTGEISAANQSVSPGRSELSRIPTPPDWIDRATGRARTLFIGKALANSDSLWTLEFWNQSIQDVWSVDATAPPPGPVTTPNFLRTDGALDPQLPVDWAVTPPEIAMIGKIAESAGGLNLYRVPHPIRAQSFVTGITADGWMQDASRFVRFAPHPVDGMVSISISRGAACGASIPTTRFTFRVSRLGIDSDGQPVPRATEAFVRTRVAQCASTVLHVPARAPFRIDAKATGLFKAGDGRELAAFVAYTFTPS